MEGGYCLLQFDSLSERKRISSEYMLGDFHWARVSCVAADVCVIFVAFGMDERRATSVITYRPPSDTRMVA